MAQMGAAGILASAMKAQAAERGVIPADTDGTAVGRKFYADGRVMPFAGNTIICHLPQQGESSRCFGALMDIYRDVPTQIFAPYIALTPTSSYHMTVFAGANDKDRIAGAWPEFLSKEMPIDQCNRVIAERLKSARYGIDLPLRMKIDQDQPEKLHPLTIRLKPFDDAENSKLRALRDKISASLGIRTLDHASYRFHITMAYLIKQMPKDVAEAYRPLCVAWHKQLAEVCPVIELGAPEYCVFKDMFAFERQFYLS